MTTRGRPPVARAALVLAGACVLLAAGSAVGLPGFRAGNQDLPGGRSPGSGKALVYSVRAVHRPSFDRLVFTFRGGRPRGQIRHVARVVADASGRPVPLGGRSFLTVEFTPATTFAGPGRRRRAPIVLSPRMPLLRQVKLAGDFEGHVTYGIGLARRAGVRVFALSHPDRNVVDLAAAGG